MNTETHSSPGSPSDPGYPADRDIVHISRGEVQPGGGSFTYKFMLMACPRLWWGVYRPHLQNQSVPCQSDFLSVPCFICLLLYYIS